MNQTDINGEWIKELDSNAGKLKMLVQPRHVTPGLRKPYEWVLEWDQIDALVLALRGIANKKQWLQCTLVEAKRLAFGRKVSIYLLGWRPGFCVGPTEPDGITKEQWDLIGSAVRLALQVLPDAKPYIEDWDPDDKFELRFEAYIAENGRVK